MAKFRKNVVTRRCRVEFPGSISVTVYAETPQTAVLIARTALAEFEKYPGDPVKVTMDGET